MVGEGDHISAKSALCVPQLLKAWRYDQKAQIKRGSKRTILSAIAPDQLKLTIKLYPEPIKRNDYAHISHAFQSNFKLSQGINMDENTDKIRSAD